MSQAEPALRRCLKRCSERRTLMLNCDFNKVALQLYWNHTSAWVSPVNLLHIFRTLFQNNPGGLLLHSVSLVYIPTSLKYSRMILILLIYETKLQKLFGHLNREYQGEFGKVRYLISSLLKVEIVWNAPMLINVNTVFSNPLDSFRGFPPINQSFELFVYNSLVVV